MGSQPWHFGITWRHRSRDRDHSAYGGRLPMSSPLWPCVSLALLWRYGASNIMRSRLWFFEVTRRHRSRYRDHSTRRGRLPMGSPLWPSVYLTPLRRYGASNVMGLRPWPFGVTWRHRSRDHLTSGGRLPMDGPLWPCIYLVPLRRYKASNLHLSMLKAKSSLRIFRVMWYVCRGSKMTAYLEFPGPYCLFTMPLWWGYDDD